MHTVVYDESESDLLKGFRIPSNAVPVIEVIHLEGH